MRVFLDTNVFVYADDADAGPKHAIAIERVVGHLADHTGVISTQVLQEYFAVATRKLGLPAAEARERVERMTRFHVVQVSVALILEAIDLHRLRKISFWDALIVRSAVAGGCGALLTEDLNTGEVVDGVRVVDPFT